MHYWGDTQLSTSIAVVQSLSPVQLCNPLEYSLPGSAVHGIFPGKNIGVGCHFLLEGIFLMQGSNQRPVHWQADSLLLSHQGNSRQRHWHDIFWMCGIQKSAQSTDSYYVQGIREVSQIVPVCSEYKRGNTVFIAISGTFAKCIQLKSFKDMIEVQVCHLKNQM